jgi:hypothetical protein
MIRMDLITMHTRINVKSSLFLGRPFDLHHDTPGNFLLVFTGFQFERLIHSPFLRLGKDVLQVDGCLA